MKQRSLTRFAWLSIAAAVGTITLKTIAFLLTGSVGLLSDALESSVNLVAAIVALVALTVSARPADEQHHYGHSKAEYFAAGAEGTMILIVVAAVLLRAGRRHGSITLTADGRHLLNDVWTTAGVLVGIGAVALTGWDRLDPIVAAAVGLNIVVAGWRLITRSIAGLMDIALRTRDAGARRYVSVHVLVPGSWSVQTGHDLLERLEADLDEALGGAIVSTHLEPLEDPASWADGRDHPEGHLGPP